MNTKILLEHITKGGTRIGIIETEFYPAQCYVGVLHTWTREPVTNRTYCYFKTQEGALKQFYHLIDITT